MPCFRHAGGVRFLGMEEDNPMRMFRNVMMASLVALGAGAGAAQAQWIDKAPPRYYAPPPPVYYAPPPPPRVYVPPVPIYVPPPVIVGPPRYYAPRPYWGYGRPYYRPYGHRRW